MRYICTSADIVNEPNKNPYVQITFESHTGGVGELFIAQTMSKVRMAMSGGNFTPDNKPDFNKNLKWCQENAPKMVGQEAEIEKIEVEVEPYYRIVDKKLERDKEGKPVVYNTVNVNCLMYLDEATGEYRPAMSEAQIKRQAIRMLNSFPDRKTVAEYNRLLEAKQRVNATTEQTQQPTQQPAQAPFAPGNGVVDDLPM